MYILPLTEQYYSGKFIYSKVRAGAWEDWFPIFDFPEKYAQITIEQLLKIRKSRVFASFW